MVPVVSVIIPTYNRPLLLQKAIVSVLAQTYTTHEIIVVQNGPDQAAKPYVDDFNSKGAHINYIYESRAGSANARNVGVKNARGEYVAFLDDDDEWFPEKLSNQISFLEKNEEVGLVSCRGLRIKDKEEISDIIPAVLPKNGLNYKTLLKEGAIIPSLSSVVVRKKYFDQCGLFDTSYEISDDHEFYIRLATRCELAILEEPLFLYHWHGENISKKTLQMYQEKVSILRMLLKSPHVNASKADLKQSIKHYASKFYALATDYKDKKEYGEASKHYLAALNCDPFVGLQIPWSRFQNPFYRLAKPYAAVLICVARSLGNSRG